MNIKNSLIGILMITLILLSGIAYAEDWNLGATSTFTGINTTGLNVSGTPYFSGNVGIGTASPSSPNGRTSVLQIGDNGVATSGSLVLGHDGTGYADAFEILTSGGSNAGSLTIAKNTTAYMTLLDGGDVGIGTASPNRKFVVKSSGTGYNGGIALEGYTTTNQAINMYSYDDYTGVINMTQANAGVMISLNSGGGSYINGGNFGIKNTTLPNIITVQQASDTDPIADSWTTYPSDIKHKKDLTQLSKTETKYLEKAKNWTGTTWKRNGTVSREEAISALGIKKVAISSASAFEEVPVYEDRPTGQTKITYTYNSNGDVLPVSVNVTQKVQNGTIKQLKAKVTFDTSSGNFYQETTTWTEEEIALKINELEAIKQALPKYQTLRVGALIDENTPPEVLVYDSSGNVQGYDLLALALYQGEVIRELAYQVDSLKTK